MAETRIKDLVTSAAAPVADDFVALDGSTNATRKLPASYFGTVKSVSITAPAEGLAITGGPITGTGTFAVTLANDLAAVEGLATTGIVRRTGPNTWSAGTAVALATEASGILPVANGGTGTATPAIVAGTNVTLSGTWPNQTVNVASHSHAATEITSGVLNPARLASGTALQVYRRNAANDAIECATVSAGGDFVAALTSTEVSVTGAITLDSTAFGKLHVCSGTSADYTVVLPTAVGNGSKFIAFRFSPALTKLVTLDANSTQLIAGVLTRKFWAQESVVLMSDGSNWVRIAGADRPMSALLVSAATTIVHNTDTIFQMSSVARDDSPGARMGSTATDSITVPRACLGIVGYNQAFVPTAGTVYTDSAKVVSNVHTFGILGTESRISLSATTYSFAVSSMARAFAQDEVLQNSAFINRGGADTPSNGGAFYFTEISQWLV